MTVLRPARHRVRALVVTTVAAVVVPVAVAAPAHADQTIATLGPLSGITITSDLNCAVNQVGDERGEWYGDLACGTFLALGPRVYGPASVPAGFAPTPWTPVSQSPVTGDGSAAAPYTVSTTVKAGNTGVRLTQVDTYVTGEQSYRTDVTVSNTATTAKAYVLYRAGDCYFSDSDAGFGRVDSGAPSCVAPDYDDPSVPGPRAETFVPVTAGSHYDIEQYSTMWTKVAAGGALGDFCACDPTTGSYDNGMALSWSGSLAGGASAVYSHQTRFSPPPLRTTVTVDDASVVPGSADAVGVVVTNATVQAVTLDRLEATLPDGFTLTPGSTSGVTTADPTVNGRQLTWPGPFTVPAGGQVSLRFGVGVGSDTRTATVTATGRVSTPVDQTVAPGSVDVDVAPVTLTAVSPTAVPVGSSVSFAAYGTTLSEGGRLTVSGRGVTVSATTLSSSQEIDGTLTVTGAAPLGARTVTYTDPDGHTATCARCLTIDPRPAITALTPPTIGQGAVNVTVLVDGSGFLRNGAVYLSGGTVTRRTWISATQLRLQVSVAASTPAGATTLTVDNGDGGNASADLTVTAAPRLTGANPTSVARGTSQDVTFTGRNLRSGLTVTAAGAGITVGPPTAVTATSFTVTVTVAATAAVGKPAFTVVNPDGGRSTAKVLTIS